MAALDCQVIVARSLGLPAEAPVKPERRRARSTFDVRSSKLFAQRFGRVDPQAASGGAEGGGYRAIVTPSANSLVDLAQSFQGNAQFIDDSINWLIGAEDLGGTTESEEDVKIEHTTEGQSAWFYVTVLGIPIGVLVLGGVHLRVRRAGAKRGGVA